MIKKENKLVNFIVDKKLVVLSEILELLSFFFSGFFIRFSFIGSLLFLLLGLVLAIISGEAMIKRENGSRRS